MSEYTLDFLEAVKALDEGKCEGIENEIGGQYHFSEIGAIVYTVKWGNKKDTILFPKNLLGKWKLVGVKPRTEERTIKYWLVISKDGAESFVRKEALILGKGDIQQFIPLSHTYTYTFPEEILHPVMDKILNNFEKGAT